MDGTGTIDPTGFIKSRSLKFPKDGTYLTGKVRGLLRTGEYERELVAAALKATRASYDGLRTVPGQIQLQRIPFEMKSRATDLVRPTTAALVTPYVKRLGAAIFEPSADDMLIIDPPPRSTIPGSAARIVRYIEVTFRSRAKSHSSSVASSAVPW